MTDALNISQGVGNGEATVLQWGNTDKAINQLYQEQQQREARGYQDYQASQQQLQKEFANVRSADIPDVMDAYGKYKTLSQQMLFDHKVKNNPQAYATLQQQANEAKANLYGLISASTETKDFDKGLAPDFLSHPDQYAENAGQLHQQAMQMTTRQRIAKGLNSPQPYLYTGTNTDMGAIDKAAQGEKREVTLPEVGVGDGIQYRTDVYKYGNTPAQYAATTLGKFAEKRAGADAAKTWDNIPEEKKNDIDTRYNDLLKDEDYWKGVGAPPQPLQASNPQNKAEQLAVYKAKEYALNNRPSADQPKYRTDEAAKMQLQAKDRKDLEDYQNRNKVNFEAMRQGNRLAMLAARQQYKKKDAAGQEEFLDKYLGDMKASAQPVPYKYANGKTETHYTVKASPDIKAIFKVPDGSGHYIHPDELQFLPNGDVQPIFYKRTPISDVKDPKTGATHQEGGEIIKVNGKGAVDEEFSKPVNRKDFKLQLGKKYLSKKDLNADMSNDDYEDDGSSSFNPPANILQGLSDYLNTDNA